MDGIRIQRGEGLLTLEIHRAAQRNAVNMPMFEIFAHELDSANFDDMVHAVLLCGVGDGYCAGHDLQASDRWPQSADDPVPRFLHALAALRKPLVIAVQGWAVGIGATALLHADWMITAPDASLRFPFLDLDLDLGIGIGSEAGSSLLLARPTAAAGGGDD